ncbi:MAG: hypothetical protein HY070_07030, partial [Chloroflexi bacterium]|nr:hypothetical protein [Chloroflexota bacterium]
MRIFLCARICFFFLLVLAACASPLDSTPPIIFSRDFVTPSPAPRASVAPLPTLTQNFSATPRVVGSPAPTVPSNFKLLAHNSLDARRNNGGLAIANNCAYVGSRGGAQPIAVLDISNPTQPTLIGRVTLARGMDARELRAVSDLNLLVVMTIDLGANQRAANGVHLYDIRDCRAPKFIAAFDFGDVAPHEFHLWRDPQRPARLLAFVAMFSAARGIQVIDLSDPVRPTRVVEWNYGVTIHSISISDDGTRAFIAAWDAGLLIADSSEIAESKSNPTLRAISHLPYANSSTHSAVSIPARRLVIL